MVCPSSGDPREVIVIFDLDGTVWDSEEGILGSVEHTFESLRLPVPPRELLATNVGPPLHEMLAQVGVPLDLVDEGVVRYRERYRSWGAYRATVYPGIAELLVELRAVGRQLATATSKGEAPTRLMLDHFGLRERFDVVGAATMDTTATTKAQVIGRTLAALGDPDPATCVMVGDRRYDVEGAALHGIECIGVGWGYATDGELVDAGADTVVHSVAELRDALLSRALRMADR